MESEHKTLSNIEGESPGLVVIGGEFENRFVLTSSVVVPQPVLTQLRVNPIKHFDQRVCQPTTRLSNLLLSPGVHGSIL